MELKQAAVKFEICNKICSTIKPRMGEIQLFSYAKCVPRVYQYLSHNAIFLLIYEYFVGYTYIARSTAILDHGTQILCAANKSIRNFNDAAHNLPTSKLICSKGERGL